MASEGDLVRGECHPSSRGPILVTAALASCGRFDSLNSLGRCPSVQYASGLIYDKGFGFFT